MSELKPCPFCAMPGERLLYQKFKNEGIIVCSCGVKMRFENEPERYELVGGDIYKKIPMKPGYEIAKECWNRRASE